jgi:hypothetical protein
MSRYTQTVIIYIISSYWNEGADKAEMFWVS